MSGISDIKVLSFPLGRIVATPGALELMEEGQMVALIRRHALNDWGELDGHDIAANRMAIENQGQILSCYIINDRKVYVITEGDRSATTVLLSDEY